ncbi:MAG: hypothetical protein F6K39_46705 [Okeania sp. SIO3B3]|nr:hypothetical protein [Okeania sp. SIO3B3]
MVFTAKTFFEDSYSRKNLPPQFLYTNLSIILSFAKKQKLYQEKTKEDESHVDLSRGWKTTVGVKTHSAQMGAII